jgi:hypothetical protein
MAFYETMGILPVEYEQKPKSEIQKMIVYTAYAITVISLPGRATNGLPQ